MNRFEEEDFGMFIQLTRQIWLRRNKWLYEGTFTSPNDIVNATANYAEDFKLANEKPIPKVYVNENGQDEKWTAPTHGWYKANWDFAFNNSAGRMGVGVIVRDEKGEVAVAWSKSCLGSLEPTTGEAFALFHAVTLCNDVMFPNVILEGDAKLVPDALNSNQSRGCRFGHLIEDTRHVLQLFSRWKCVFTKRVANEAAHRLAKRATLNIGDRIWRSQVLDCISDVVLMERLTPSS
jgi:ribonuclease HI